MGGPRMVTHGGGVTLPVRPQGWRVRVEGQPLTMSRRSRVGWWRDKRHSFRPQWERERQRERDMWFTHTNTLTEWRQINILNKDTSVILFPPCYTGERLARTHRPSQGPQHKAAPLYSVLQSVCCPSSDRLMAFENTSSHLWLYRYNTLLYKRAAVLFERLTWKQQQHFTQRKREDTRGCI